MDTVICKELIVATLTRRGRGVKHSPVRVITQVFEKDGTLVAEHDPVNETFGVKDLFDFAKWVNAKGYYPNKLNTAIFDEWIDSSRAE